MKTAIKVFLIIGIVASAISMFLGLRALLVPIDLDSLGIIIDIPSEFEQLLPMFRVVYGVVVAIVAALGIVFGVLAFKKLNVATEKKQLIANGILVLIFCNLIAGILMLAIPQSALDPQA